MKINNLQVNLHDYFRIIPLHEIQNKNKFNKVFAWECKICKTVIQAKSRPSHLRYKHPRKFDLPDKKPVYEHINRSAWIQWYNSLPENRRRLELLTGGDSPDR